MVIRSLSVLDVADYLRLRNSDLKSDRKKQLEDSSAQMWMSDAACSASNFSRF
jgi:hypothetical protein